MASLLRALGRTAAPLGRTAPSLLRRSGALPALLAAPPSQGLVAAAAQQLFAQTRAASSSRRSAAPIPRPFAHTAARLGPSPVFNSQQQRRRQAGLLAMQRTAHKGIALREILSFLEDHYGLRQQVVQQPLTEAAEILGYKHPGPDTAIRFGDAQVLFEEVGTEPVTYRELRQALRGARRGARADPAQGEKVPEEGPEVEDMDAWARLQNTKDLLAMARRHHAKVESLPQGQGWLKVILPEGAVLHFKQVGKKALGKDAHNREKVETDKKVAIRLILNAHEFEPQRHEVEDQAQADHDGDHGILTKSRGARRRLRLKSKIAKFDKENLQRRERLQCHGPRRRGKTIHAHLPGRRVGGARAAA